LSGSLFDLMDKIYYKSDTECNIDIAFNPSSDGTQKNPCRDLIIEYLKAPDQSRGRKIAERLAGVTTHRSGLGLLFLISGMEGMHHKFVVSRFPADNAILAEEDQNSLSLEFLERVFMKNAASYKAVVYRDLSLSAGFWIGNAIDKQLSNSEIQISDYWIKSFLDSDFQSTPAGGTRRLALLMRDAIRTTDNFQVKNEIAAAATLAGGLSGQNTSIKQFVEKFNLSDITVEAIKNEMRDPNIIDQQFQFDRQEFKVHLPYRSVELDTGVRLSAPSEDFNNVLKMEDIAGEERKIRFTTEGKIKTENLGKSK